MERSTDGSGPKSTVQSLWFLNTDGDKSCSLWWNDVFSFGDSNFGVKNYVSTISDYHLTENPFIFHSELFQFFRPGIFSDFWVFLDRSNFLVELVNLKSLYLFILIFVVVMIHRGEKKLGKGMIRCVSIWSRQHFLVVWLLGKTRIEIRGNRIQN